MQTMYFIEQWKDRKGETHLTKMKPINEFNVALTKSKYGYKTIAVFKIKPKFSTPVNN